MITKAALYTIAIILVFILIRLITKSKVKSPRSIDYIYTANGTYTRTMTMEEFRKNLKYIKLNPKFVIKSGNRVVSYGY